MMPIDASSYAGFGRRLLALVIDWMIFSLVSATAFLCIQWTSYEPRLDGYLLAYSVQGIAVLFCLYCWLILQGTPGKLLVGCRIVDARTGTSIKLWQAIARLCGYVLSALPLLLGFLWVVKDPRRQSLHDKLARTVVVIEDDSRKTLAQLAQEAR